MFHYLYQCLGYRKKSPNIMGDEVVLCEWHHPIYNPSSHLGLKIHKEGQDYYFSFSPKSAYDLVHIPFAELRTGLEGFMVRNFDDERLLWGFRNAWGEGIIEKLSQTQITKMIGYYHTNHPHEAIDSQTLTQAVLNDFSHLRDSQLLELAQLFPEDIKNGLRALGQPNGGTTVLRTLDLNAMIDKINEFAASQPKWAPLAGTYSHQENTYNCASIVLTILYAGKMDGLITTRATQWAAAGTLVGLLSLIVTQTPEVIGESVAGGLVGGRIFGAAQDSYLDIQHFFNMIAGTPEDNVGTVLGLRILSTVCGGIIGALKSGPFLPAYLCLPKNVVELSRQAEQTEKSIYVFNARENRSSAPSYV